MANPVTLANAKVYLRTASGTAEDAIIQDMLDGAADFIAKECGIAFAVGTHEDMLNGGAVSLRTLVGPLQTVTSIVDAMGGADPILESNYRLVLTAPNDRIVWCSNGALADYMFFPVGRVPMLTDSNWPAGSGRWIVTYTAGYAEGSCPAPLKMAIMDLCKRMYDMRGGVRSESSEGAGVSFGDFWDSNFAKMVEVYTRGGRM